jgi:Fe-S cluster assembly iron-binding protein IscA
MVQITERAGVELRRLLTEHFARPHQGVRLRLNQAGHLAMTIDVPHDGDSVIRRDNVAVLIVEGRLSSTLAKRVLDFPGSSVKTGFTLAWRLPGAPPESEPVAQDPGVHDVT